jgi:NNP family nitrate/nitrite transporter-like MFS transporter
VASLVATGPGAWRWGVGLCGLVAAAYGAFFLVAARDTPEGRTYRRPRRHGALQVRSPRAVLGLVLLQIPIVGALGLVAYRIERAGVLTSTGLLVCYVVLGVFLLGLVWRVVQVNAPALRGSAAPDAVPSLVPVALLSLAYAVTFGTELSVISLLPTYFANTFGLKIAAAGIAGSAFAFTNLVARPAGGLISDLTGRRVRVLVVLLLGTAVGFTLIGFITSNTPLWLSLVLVVIASLFVQAGNGAVFAMVPLVSRASNGQVAGMAGSYGNIGGVVFSSVLFFTATTTDVVGDTTLLFAAIASSALVVGVLCLALLRLAPADGSVIDLEGSGGHEHVASAALAMVNA